MSEIPVPEFIQNLTDCELRRELAKNGERVGPITPTTRKLYKRRLLRKLNVTTLANAGKTTENKENIAESHENSDKTTQTAQNEAAKIANSASTQTEDLETTPTKKNQYEQSFPRKLPTDLAENQENTHSDITLPSSKQDNKPSVTSPSITEGGDVKNDKLYYGIQIANSKLIQQEPIVFENKSTALATLKKHKNARFKEFNSFESAKEFSLHISEPSETKTSSAAAESSDAANSYPSLKQEDLNKLTRCIEKGDLAAMSTLVWKNPKYLISSADGPVTLKPNARYNALHIAAKCNQPEICREILQLIHNQSFQTLLFSNTDNEDLSKQRTEHIVDAYLNTPDKILFETPLHFASKSGYADVVKELVSYERCSTSMLNKSNQTALDIVCSRALENLSANKTEIVQLLTKRYYVPLLRCHDNSTSAVVGEPIISKYEYDDSSSLELSVHAIAGPMLKMDAEEFRQKWVTPSKQRILSEKFRYVRRYDCDKGDEQIGRELASRGEIGWSEFWDFLNDFANFSTENGLQKLENYLQSCHRSNSSLEIDKLADMLQNVHFSHGQQNDSIEYESNNGPTIDGHANTAKNHNSVKSETLIKPSSFNPSERASSQNLMEEENIRQPSLLNKTEKPSCTNFPNSKSNPTRSTFPMLGTDSVHSSTEKSGYPVTTDPSDGTASHVESESRSTDARDSASVVPARLSRLNQFSSVIPEENSESFMPDLQNLTTEYNSSGSGDVRNINEKSETEMKSVNRSEQSFSNLRLAESKAFDNDSICKPSDAMSVDDLYFVDGYRCHSDTESALISSLSCSTISDTFPHNQQIFLNGLCPTKRDQDVVTAIGNFDINPEKFPAIFRWQAAVLTFSEIVRQKWSTPRKPSGLHSQSASDVPMMSASFTSSPLPSSGRVDNMFATPPPRDLRRLLFKSMTPPWPV